MSSRARPPTRASPSRMMMMMMRVLDTATRDVAAYTVERERTGLEQQRNRRAAVRLLHRPVR